jgi:5-formyltetrahydrofolate cyclo-ligase
MRTVVSDKRGNRFAFGFGFFERFFITFPLLTLNGPASLLDRVGNHQRANFPIDF